MFHTFCMDKTALQAKWDMISPLLDERARRLWAITESEALGWGGITLVSEVTGLSRQTIHTARKAAHGMAPGEYAKPFKAGRVRTEGAGRKNLADGDPSLARDLEFRPPDIHPRFYVRSPGSGAGI